MDTKRRDAGTLKRLKTVISATVLQNQATTEQAMSQSAAHHFER